MKREPLPHGTVTFLFSDIEESTELVRRVGDDAFAAIRAEHRRLLRDSFAAHGGSEIETAGDGFFVAFDSARSAAKAAVEAQRALASSTWQADAEVLVRMGLHTAEPHLTEDGYVGVGVHRAARICDAARGGQILVSNATAGIVEDAELPGIELVDLGEHRLKGLPRQQRLFQLVGEGLRSGFGPLRTPEAQPPGAGTFLLIDLAGWVVWSEQSETRQLPRSPPTTTRRWRPRSRPTAASFSNASATACWRCSATRARRLGLRWPLARP
ncbi:MAG: adenylate/guanylate cyclase domain-containing protein [Gaiellaceae bacterium]